ncbi:HAMP domain-containing histidine kinase [Iamia sp. SCSIO 61187]|uniref:HAMP domain-containing sensor histidine kinase n=1 Tax=Iamia sp. SCSIO 61187 TaxID=2722752 RepID=UPI001C639DE9|nr:HAMP domain-containing sensor histidine kinase [Iamia sp. SCSIO 61187]QYG93506.1 HAMP domain-containing histidine kinase [Iamia sp. SCSIO 61187]
MRTRLLVGTLLLATAAIVAFFIPAAFALDDAERAAHEAELQREAADAAALLGERYESVRGVGPDGGVDQDGDDETDEDGGEDDETDRPVPAGADEDHLFGLYDADGRLVLGVGPPGADDPVRSALRGRSATARVGDLRVAAVPLAGGGAVRAAEPASEADVRTRAAILRLASAALLVLLAGSVAAWLLARRLTRPLRDVGRSATRLGGGDFTATAPTTGIAEIDEVASALNTSATRIGAMVARERRLTADTSHQLRTPLAGLRVALETELAHPRPDPTAVLTEALGAVERMEGTVDALTDLARDEEVGAPIALDEVVAAAAERWRPFLRAQDRPLHVEAASQATVSARVAALDTILDVLLDNALHHGLGAVTLAAEAAGGSARVVVADEGRCPLADDRLFARRSSSAGRTGIGLHLARSLADAEAGRLRLVDQDPTTFQLVLATVPGGG